MARRSAADKAETHEHILRQASRAFRSHGAAVGIGEVMKELGLTRGGFYRHFESKDELLIAAITLSLEEMGDKFERIATKAEPGKQLEAIITAYLSTEHLQHPETWCTLASLAPELGRQPAAVRKRLDGALAAYNERMAQFMPGETIEDRRRTFLILFPAMAGSIALMRSFGDKASRDRVLAITREYYLATFAT